MDKKVETLSDWIIKQTDLNSKLLLDAVKQGNFDLEGNEIILDGDIETLIKYEFLFLNFHLADMYIYENIPDSRNVFQDSLIKKVLDNMGLGMSDDFVETYNDRLQKYSKYKKLIPTNKNDPTKNTLFWEFGKYISLLITGTNDNLMIIMFVKGLGVESAGNLWKLKIFT